MQASAAMPDQSAFVLGKKGSVDSPVVSLKNGLSIQSHDGNRSLTLGGYFQQDVALFSGDDSGLNDSTNTRRARVYIKGNLAKDWQYNFMYDFAGGGAIKNARISYSGFSHQILTGGIFLTNLGVGEYTSNSHKDFMEFALPVYAFLPTHSPGVSYTAYSQYVAFHDNVFAPKDTATVTGSDPIANTARMTYDPVYSNGRLLHFGAGMLYQKIDSAGSVTFSPVPEVRTRNNQSLISATIDNAKYYTTYDLESAYEKGPFEAQAEYLRTRVYRTANANPTFPGFYVAAGYFITGEHREYNKKLGVFSGISPIQHAYGAFQVITRYSQLDLTDHGIEGGKEQNVSVGLNWFYNRFLRVMFNYIHAKASPDSDGLDRSANIYGLRMQVSF